LDYTLTIETDSGKIESFQMKKETPPDVGIEYAEDGYSVETKYGICVRSKWLDEYLDKMMKGDIYEQAVAAKTPRWFCMAIDGREYTVEALNTLKANYWDGYQFTWGNQMVWQYFITPDGDTVKDIVTPIQGFEYMAVDKLFVAGMTYMLENDVKHRRAQANPNLPKPSPSR